MSKIVFIEFDDNRRPFAAVCLDRNKHTDYYDIEWCKRDGELYANHSGGGLYLESQNHKFWVAPGYEPDKYRPENRLANKPKKYTGDLDTWTLSDDCSYCSICDDMLPHEDLCEHIWWDDKVSWYSTPDDRKE